jgi:hypothetical protein
MLPRRPRRHPAVARFEPEAASPALSTPASPPSSASEDRRKSVLVMELAEGEDSPSGCGGAAPRRPCRSPARWRALEPPREGIVHRPPARQREGGPRRP